MRKKPTHFEAFTQQGRAFSGCGKVLPASSLTTDVAEVTCVLCRNSLVMSGRKRVDLRRDLRRDTDDLLED